MLPSSDNAFILLLSWINYATDGFLYKNLWLTRLDAACVLRDRRQRTTRFKPFLHNIGIFTLLTKPRFRQIIKYIDWRCCTTHVKSQVFCTHSSFFFFWKHLMRFCNQVTISLLSFTHWTHKGFCQRSALQYNIYQNSWFTRKYSNYIMAL